MNTRESVLLGILLLALAWVGSAGIAYAVVELAGSGEQGLPGEQGPAGK